MDHPSLHFRTIAELSGMLSEGSISPVQLTEHFLSRIEALDGTLHAFKTVCRQRALAEASAAEAALSAGRSLSPLHGIPYAVKDLFDVKGLPTSAGTHLLESDLARDDSAAVKKLSQAGMILLGKTHTVQFAYSGIGINHDHGTPRNPWARDHHVPGGSSSGSGVAVSAGLVPMALGTDTSGSVRIPASLCGITGLKPSVGRISRAGVYPLSMTYDSVGPLARSVTDAALVYQTLQGPDPDDRATLNLPLQDVLQEAQEGIRGMRVAFAASLFGKDVDPEVEKAVLETGNVLEALGAHVEHIRFGVAEELLQKASQAKMVASEAYAQNKDFIENHFDDLDPVISSRLVKGRDIPAWDYVLSQAHVERLRRATERRLKHMDALLVPATLIPAAAVQAVDQNQEIYTRYNLTYLRNTAVGSALNLCGLTVPCGTTAKGLPTGLLILGKPYEEDVVVRIGCAYQTATEWHRRFPDVK